MHDLVWFATRPAIATDGITRLLRVVCSGSTLTCVAGVQSVDDAELWITWHRQLPDSPYIDLGRLHGVIWYPLGSTVV